MKSTAMLLLGALFLVSCSDDDDAPAPVIPDPVPKGVVLNLEFSIDGDPLQFDTIRYWNEAGNHYGVTHLEFYISRIMFHYGCCRKEIDTVFYINARKPETLSRMVCGVPEGIYDSVTVTIGVDSANNVFGHLPATPENINMEWPLSMGGGYHHMKLEGYYESGMSVPGYAMHLGNQGLQVWSRCYKSVAVDALGQANLNLNMNLNEWYKNPAIYDFDIDGNHSMGNMPAMMKLKLNGTDVFYQ